MRAINTNVLVRIVARDHASQTRAADRCIADGAWVSIIVLAEFVWVFKSVYGFSRARLNTLIEMMLNHVSIVVQDADIVADALALFRASKKVEFADCLVLAAAQRAGHVPLATFDRTFAKMDSVELIG